MSATAASSVPMRNSADRHGTVGLVREGIREVLARRRLVRYLVQTDIKKKGADTLLGNLWWILDPLLQMMVYVIFVSVIFVRKTPDYPLFVFASILPWKWFQASVNDAITSVTAREALIRQLQFPKLVLPVAATGAGVVNFAFGMVPLAGLLILLYSDRISPYLLLIPVVGFVQLVFTLAVTVMLAAANVFVRDVGNIARHFLRLWFYLSPGLYPMSLLTESSLGKEFPGLVTILKLNPFAVLFEAYHAIIYGTATEPPFPPNWEALGILLGVSVVLVAVSVAVFKRLEPSFAKVL